MTRLTPIGLLWRAARVGREVSRLWHATARPGSYHADLHAEAVRLERALADIRWALHLREDVRAAEAREHQELMAALGARGDTGGMHAEVALGNIAGAAAARRAADRWVASQ
jgi:hypothetical protein